MDGRNHAFEKPGEACVILAAGLVFAVCVALHLFHLNGNFYFTYWTWTWRNLGLLKTGGLCLAPLLVILWVLRKSESELSPAAIRWGLTALAASNFLLQILSMLADPRGLDLVRQIVQSAQATSYFTDATVIRNVPAWLAHFHEAKLNLHAMTHPPGPVLFYYAFQQMFDSDYAALIGGCAVGLLGSLGTIVMYHFSALWTDDSRTRITASAFYALLPGLSVFFPEFDQVYPILSMLLVIFWIEAVSEPRPGWRDSIAAGAILFVASFFAYNPLTVGIFMAYFAAYRLWRAHGAPAAWRAVLQSALIAAATCAALYSVLWLATGYRPYATLRQALANQAVLQWRPYFPFPLWDPYDFFLGTGILAVPILFFYLKRLRKPWSVESEPAALTLIGLATILTIDVSGVLRAETTRVWLFLQPLVVVPVALELRRYAWGWRLAIFVLQWWILVSLKSNMSFVNP